MKEYIWEENSLIRGKSLCESPGAGACLDCSKVQQKDHCDKENDMR